MQDLVETATVQRCCAEPDCDWLAAQLIAFKRGLRNIIDVKTAEKWGLIILATYSWLIKLILLGVVFLTMQPRLFFQRV